MEEKRHIERKRRTVCRWRLTRPASWRWLWKCSSSVRLPWPTPKLFAYMKCRTLNSAYSPDAAHTHAAEISFHSPAHVRLLYFFREQWEELFIAFSIFHPNLSFTNTSLFVEERNSPGKKHIGRKTLPHTKTLAYQSISRKMYRSRARRNHQALMSWAMPTTDINVSLRRTFFFAMPIRLFWASCHTRRRATLNWMIKRMSFGDDLKEFTSIVIVTWRTRVWRMP